MQCSPIWALSATGAFSAVTAIMSIFTMCEIPLTEIEIKVT